MKYVVYDQRGAIIRAGECPPAMVWLQADKTKGELVVVGYANDLRHYVDVSQTPHVIKEKE